MESNTPPADATIADDIERFMRRFIVFSDDRQATALALWILHTYAFDAAYTTPYIYVTSAEKRSGKTRVIEVLNLLARHSITAGSVTSASMYRMIESDEPTIFLDEVDTVFSGPANEEMRNFLNNGYKKGGKVYRFTGKETEAFSTFCPKLLAGIDNAAMPDTILDRSIKIVLKRKKTGEGVERFMYRKVAEDAENIQAACGEWARENLETLLNAEPDVIDSIGDRAFEIAEPLLAIAECLGHEWNKKAREAMEFLLREEVAALSKEGQALQAARDYMDEKRTDRIASAVLMELTGVNGKQLGAWLSKYDVKPQTISINGRMAKGYTRAAMADAWERYL